MLNEIACPSCDDALRLPDDLLGQHVRCPTCGKVFTATLETKPPPEGRSFPLERRSRHRPPEDLEEDESLEEDEDDYPERRGFRCPYCGSDEPPLVSKQMGQAGLIVLIVLIFFCWPLFWIGFLIQEEKRRCRDCGRNLS